MSTAYSTKQLRDGEEVLAEVHRAPLSFLGTLVWTGLFLLGPFFLLFPLLRLGAVGVMLFTGGITFGVLLLVRLLFLLERNMLRITNQRLIDIDQHGFFRKTVSETPLDKVEDVSFSIGGVRQTVFRFGTVHIETAGSQANVEVRNVAQPESVHAAIMEAIRQYSAERSTPVDKATYTELLTLLRSIRRRLGHRRFALLLKEIDAEVSEARADD